MRITPSDLTSRTTPSPDLEVDLSLLCDHVIPLRALDSEVSLRAGLYHEGRFSMDDAPISLM